VSLCIAVGLLLISPGTALGISGFADDQAAVRAQYPDSSALETGGPAPVISSLGDVITDTRRVIARDPKARARLLSVQPTVRRRVVAAMSSATGLDPPQSGSIALLVPGIAVLAAGGVLRWRRGLARTE
jgi:hypothetical protein